MASSREEVGKMMVDHYQRTYDMTYQQGEDRNRLFLYLVLTTGAGLLFSSYSLFQQFALIWLGKYVFDNTYVGDIKNLSDQQYQQQVNDLVSQSGNFVIAIFQGVLILAVFYLMFNLYHRTVTVLRNYQYLGRMEIEIRDHLGLAKSEISFTREGKNYWTARPRALGWAGRWVFPVILILVIGGYLIARMIDLVGHLQTFGVGLEAVLGPITLVTGAAIGIYLVAYIRAASRFDTPVIHTPAASSFSAVSAASTQTAELIEQK